MGAAPFFAALAQGPEAGGAVWLTASDGVRLRAGYWPGGGRGTVVLLPGRCEYVEKYGRTAVELRRAGWSVVAIDWRGQGLADRLLPDPMRGHVGRFADYQLDLDAVLDWLAQAGPGLGLAAPLVMLAHSMGGLIGLRALHRRPEFRAVAFSAPMWGIRLPLWRVPMAAVLSRIPYALPGDEGYAPSATGQNYLFRVEFPGNHLTSDPEAWDFLRAQAAGDPRLGLGGPSLGWVRTALAEIRQMRRQPSPRVPCLMAVGGQEHIVLPGPIRQMAASWPGARLLELAEARHEILLETAPLRGAFLQAATELFESAVTR